MCSVDGCDRDVYRKGLCRRHHYRLKTHGSPNAGGPLRETRHAGQCSIPGCGGAYLAKGLCAKHYQARARNGDPLYARPMEKDLPCLVRGCTEKRKAKGYCGKHYQRAAKHGDPMVSLRADIGTGALDAKGYVIVGAKGHPNADRFGKIREHRLIMAQMLGRPLLKTEQVHHINGVRSDNRPENLELWSTSQPAGKRIPDMVAWAREILSIYDAEEDRLVGPDKGRRCG